jgi:hypothetical protein
MTTQIDLEKAKKKVKEDDALVEWGKALMIIGEGLILFSKAIDEIEEIK